MGLFYHGGKAVHGLRGFDGRFAHGEIFFKHEGTQRGSKVCCVAQRVDFFLTIARDDRKQRATTITQPTFVAFVSFVFKGF
jgi:hypothetical protein